MRASNAGASNSGPRYSPVSLIDLGLDNVNGVTTKHIQRKATALHGHNHNHETSWGWSRAIGTRGSLGACIHSLWQADTVPDDRIWTNVREQMRLEPKLKSSGLAKFLPKCFFLQPHLPQWTNPLCTDNVWLAWMCWFPTCIILFSIWTGLLELGNWSPTHGLGSQCWRFLFCYGNYHDRLYTRLCHQQSQILPVCVDHPHWYKPLAHYKTQRLQVECPWQLVLDKSVNPHKETKINVDILKTT